MLIQIKIHFCSPCKQMHGGVRCKGWRAPLKGWRTEMVRPSPLRCLQSLSLIRREEKKGHQPYHPLRESLSLHPLWSFSRRHDQWGTRERAARAYHSAMLWQRLPSAMLCLLRDGSVTAWLDWHSVKWGLLGALMWKDPSQQHFKHLASAKLSADFNNAHLFCTDMTTYYTDIKLFDTEYKYKQTDVRGAAACLLT